MKQLHLKYIFFTLVISLCNSLKADNFDDIVNALKAANAKEVVRFFNTNVDLTINNSEGVYSKQQAEMMIKNFLSQNAPKNVTVQHKGASAQGAKYAIINYETEQGKLRIYVFMKANGAQLLVHELRIERE